MNFFIDLAEYFNHVVLFYFLLVGSVYLLLSILSFRNIKKYARKVEYVDENKIFRLKNFRPISIIVPSFNEENGIIESIHSLLQLEYPEFQLIIVNDGSTDSTMEKIFQSFGIRQVSYSPYYKLNAQPIKGVFMSPSHPSLVVVDKLKGGKADAINAALNVAKYPLVTVIDADSILERDCLKKISAPFMEDENVIAVGGTIRIANGCEVNNGHVTKIGLPKKWIAKFQVVEYLRAFLFGRNGFDAVNGILIISGAFSCFLKDELISVGGYRDGSIGEDMEIIVRMHKVFRRINPDTKITFIPDPVCWTEAPETLKTLSKQRKRWQKGTLESIALHRGLFGNPKYGLLGVLVFPYYTIFEMFGPVIEILGYFVFAFSLLFNIVSVSFSIVFLAAAILFGILLSVLSVILEEISFRKYSKTSDLLQLFVAAVLENFGYRQLTAWWRFKGMVEYLLGKRNWGRMEKKGFVSVKEIINEPQVAEH